MLIDAARIAKKPPSEIDLDSSGDEATKDDTRTDEDELSQKVQDINIEEPENIATILETGCNELINDFYYDQ